MVILLYLLKWHLISCYFFIKLVIKQKKQVCFLSRQTNEISLNYEKIMASLKKEHIPYNSVIKKVNANINDSLRTQGNYSNTANFLKIVFHNLKSALSYYVSLYSQMHLIASSKVIITDGYNLPVCLLKHKKGTKVIQIWHALGAVKQFGYQVLGNKDGVSPKVAKILKMHYNYDYVLSSSAEMGKFFAEAFQIDATKILAIGTPTIDYLKTADKQLKNKLLSDYPNLKRKKVVLYVPTFRVNKENGLDNLIKNFDFNKFNLIVRLHPKDANTVLDNRVVNIKGKEYNTLDLIKCVDYVITDYSSMMVDALVANKKVLFYCYDYDTYTINNGLNIDLIKEYPHLAKKKASDLIKALTNYDQAEYELLKEKYYPKVDNATKRILKLIKRCLDEK